MPKVKAGGIEFEYDVTGPENGEPLILVMGFGAQMTHWPDDFREALGAKGFRVYRFDNRDCGLSQQFDDAPAIDGPAVMKALANGDDATDLVPYILDDMAADLAAIIEALDIKPAHVAGASMGGMIVQLLALNHPEHIRTLIPIMTTSGDTTLPTASPEAIEVLLAQPASSEREDVVAHSIKGRRLFGSHESIRDADEILAQRAAYNYDRAYRPAGIARQYSAIMAQPRWHERLSHLALPTLVLHGEIDPLIPAACGRDIAERVPGAKYVELENWGHDIPGALVGPLVKEISSFVFD